ncbi:hypothetical protein B0H13DRAFT_1911456 [Mycena leptocephala]|nr:hypothetical protein B0H13DRAFT_1911456 [Mycena leptocephala]
MAHLFLCDLFKKHYKSVAIELNPQICSDPIFSGGYSKRTRFHITPVAVISASGPAGNMYAPQLGTYIAKDIMLSQKIWKKRNSGNGKKKKHSRYTVIKAKHILNLTGRAEKQNTKVILVAFVLGWDEKSTRLVLEVFLQAHDSYMEKQKALSGPTKKTTKTR